MHTIKFTSRSNRVRSHTSHYDPVANLHIGHVNLIGNDIISITGHSKDTALLFIKFSDQFFGFIHVNCSIELGVIFFYAESVHENTVKAVVHSIVNMVANLTVLASFTDYSHSQMA